MAQPKSELREYVEAFAIAIVLALLIITFIAQSFLVQGPSMEPSLVNGERLLVEKVSYRFREPKRGEVIVFKYPANPRRRFIKRVIGIPGDRVEVMNNTVYVNGKPLVEPYIKGPTYGEFPAVTVKPGHVFVMGDNRNNSEDSRFSDVGQVPYRMIVGHALFTYWPITHIGIIRIPPELEAAG